MSIDEHGTLVFLCDGASSLARRTYASSEDPLSSGLSLAPVACDPRLLLDYVMDEQPGTVKRLKTSDLAVEQSKLPWGKLRAYDKLPAEWEPTGQIDLKIQDGCVSHKGFPSQPLNLMSVYCCCQLS
jgi:hypothetical protein